VRTSLVTRELATDITAQAQSAANQALAASVSTDPNVLVSKCLDLLSEAVNRVRCRRWRHGIGSRR
jgi:hypothetical protein